VPFRSLSGSLLRTWALSRNKTPTYSLGSASGSSLRHQRIACP